MDFRRIWLDKDTKDPSREGIGIWRPVPPSGYYALGRAVFPREPEHLKVCGFSKEFHVPPSHIGDCVARGFDPPHQATVIQVIGFYSILDDPVCNAWVPLLRAATAFDDTIFRRICRTRMQTAIISCFGSHKGSSGCGQTSACHRTSVWQSGSQCPCQAMWQWVSYAQSEHGRLQTTSFAVSGEDGCL